MSVAAAAAAVAAIAVVAPARAAEVVPLSYVFNAATDCGDFCYTDSTGKELIDGAVGNEGWRNPPDPWVGWTDRFVDIDFDFGAGFSFSRVAVGSTQDALNDVVLPSLKLFSSDDGVSWTQRASLYTAPDEANNRGLNSTAPHGFLTLGGLNFTSRYVRLSAENMGPWMFIDEVNFEGARAGAVPEPASWLIMLTGFFGMGLMLRAGRSAWTA